MADFSIEFERISQIATKSEQYKALNIFLNTFATPEVNFENFYNSLDANQVIHRYVIVNLIKKLNLYTHAVEILKNPPNLALRAGILNLSLLFEPPSPLTKWEYFDSEIIPHVPYLIRIKLLNKLAKFSHSSSNAEEFFTEYSKKFRLNDVICFLVQCSPEFLFNTVEKYNVKLSEFEFERLFRKPTINPKLIDLLHTKILAKKADYRHNPIPSCWPIIKRSVQTEKIPAIYDFLEKILQRDTDFTSCNFGYQIIKKLIKHDRELFIKKAETVAKFTKAKLVRSFLSQEEFNDFVLNYSGDNFAWKLFYRWEKFSVELLQTLNRKQREKLVVMLYQDKLGKNMYDINDVISVDFNDSDVQLRVLAALPPNIREAYVEKALQHDDRAAEKIQLLPVAKSVPRLREMMTIASQMAVRCSLIRPLIHTCIINDDFEELYCVLSWLFDRYRNDSASLHSQIFGIFTEKFAEITVSEKMHRLIVDQIRIAFIKQELNFQYTKTLMYLICWQFDHNQEAHDLMELYVEHSLDFQCSQKKHRAKFENLFFQVLRENIEVGKRKMETYDWINIFQSLKSKEQRTWLQADVISWLKQITINCLEQIDTYDEYDRESFLQFFYHPNSYWSRGKEQDFLQIFDQTPIQIPATKKRRKYSNLFTRKYDLTNRKEIAEKLVNSYCTNVNFRPKIALLAYHVFNRNNPKALLVLLPYILDPQTIQPQAFLNLIFDQFWLDAIQKSEINLTEFSSTIQKLFFNEPLTLEKFALKIPHYQVLAWINSNFDKNPTFQNQFLHLYFKIDSWSVFFNNFSPKISKTLINKHFLRILLDASCKDHRHQAFTHILSIFDSIETISNPQLNQLIKMLSNIPSEFQLKYHESLWTLVNRLSTTSEIQSAKVKLFYQSVICHQITLPLIEKTFDHILFSDSSEEFSDEIFSCLPQIIHQLGADPLNLVFKLYKARIMANLTEPFKKENNQLLQKTRELFQLFDQFHNNEILTLNDRKTIERILSENLSEVELTLKQMKMFDLIIDYRLAIWNFRFKANPDETSQEIIQYLDEFSKEFGSDLAIVVIMEPLRHFLKAHFTDLNRLKVYDLFFNNLKQDSKGDVLNIFIAGFLDQFSDNPQEYRMLGQKIREVGQVRPCVRVSRTLADLGAIENLVEKLVKEKKWELLDRLWMELFNITDQTVRRKIVKIFAKNDLEALLKGEEKFWNDLERFVRGTEFEMDPEIGNSEIDQMLCFYKIIDFYVKNDRSVPRSHIDYLIREFLKFSMCVWNFYSDNPDLECMFLCRFLEQILDIHPIGSDFWTNDNSIVFSLIDAIADFHERNPTRRIPNANYEWLVELFINHGFKANQSSFLIHHLELFFNPTLLPKERFMAVRKFLVIHEPTRSALDFFVHENPEFLIENHKSIVDYLLRKDHLPHNNDCKAIIDFLVDQSRQKSNILIEKIRNACIEIFKDQTRTEDWKMVAELFAKISSDEEIGNLSSTSGINWEKIKIFF